MKKAFGEYQRLARSTLGFSSLWQGEDHLLLVKGSGFILPYTEEYKRFRYRDIQALVVSSTSGHWWGTIGYGMALVIAGIIGFAILFAREPGDTYLLLLTLVLPLPAFVLSFLLLLRHLVLGPHCRMEIQTALKSEKLTAINRLHQGQMMMHRLSPIVRDAQTAVADGPHATTQESVSTTPASTAPPTLQIPRLSRLGFRLAAAFAIGLLLLLHLPSPWICATVLVIGLLSDAPLLFSLTRSVRQPTPDTIRNALWAQLVVGLIIGGCIVVYYLDQAINDPSLTLGVMGPIQAIADISILGGIAFYGILLIAGIAHLAVATVGLVQIKRWEQAQDKAPASPSA